MGVPLLDRHPRGAVLTEAWQALLRYAEDMSERQVAETLGISTGSVKTHAFRGLARLRATGHPDRTGAEEVRP